MGLNVSDNVVKPVLGLTGYLQRAKSGVWDVPMALLPAVYVEGVTLAGGIATVLPPQPVDDSTVERVLDGLDGLVITGGPDIDPASYGHDKHPATDEPPLELSERARLRELERENREMAMELAFLKKAAAYFAKEPR